VENNSNLEAKARAGLGCADKAERFILQVLRYLFSD
jgi:hypothetical protein